MRRLSRCEVAAPMGVVDVCAINTHRTPLDAEDSEAIIVPEDLQRARLDGRKGERLDEPDHYVETAAAGPVYRPFSGDVRFHSNWCFGSTGVW